MPVKRQCPPQDPLKYRLRRDKPLFDGEKAVPADIISKWLHDYVYDEIHQSLRVTLDTPFGNDVAYTHCEVTDPLTRLGLLTGGIQEGTEEFKPISIDDEGRVRVDAAVSIGEVQLDVNLTHEDDVPEAGDIHDSIRIGDGDELLEINVDGSVNVRNVDPEFEPTHFEASVPTAGTPVNITIPGKDIKLVFIFNPNKGPSKNGSQDVLFITIDGNTQKTTMPRGASRYFPGTFNTLKIDTNNDGTNYEVIVWTEV